MLLAPTPPFAAGQDDPYAALPEPQQATDPAAAEPLADVLDPDAAEFDPWEPLVEREPHYAQEPLETDAAMEHAVNGTVAEPVSQFDHVVPEDHFLNRMTPMERTSWLNRPYHVDGFLGPLLSDGPVSGRVVQSNELFTGFRVGWDFNYYWGLEWRYGRADPMLIAEVPNPADTGEEDDDIPDTIVDEFRGTYTVSDISFVYYPWGDTKVRPYVQWGLGITQIGSVRADGTGQESTLLGMPFGVGVQFPLTRWLAWRMEVVDNLAFSGDGIDSMNNFVFTAGMDVRLGARPNSYWPWRSSRTIW